VAERSLASENQGKRLTTIVTRSSLDNPIMPQSQGREKGRKGMKGLNVYRKKMKKTSHGPGI
jgi:hypothetical protein